MIIIPILASALILPQASRDFLLRDFPIPSGSRGHAVEMFVDPEGVIIGCEVLYPEMPVDRAERYCENVIGLDLGEGAFDMNGNPAHGFITIAAIPSYGPARQYRAEPDLEISVSQMPGDDDRVSIRVVANIDQQGVVQHCQPLRAEDESFAQVACAEVSNHQFDRRGGLDGHAVGYVDDLAIDFVLAHPEI